MMSRTIKVIYIDNNGPTVTRTDYHANYDRYDIVDGVLNLYQPGDVEPDHSYAPGRWLEVFYVYD